MTIALAASFVVATPLRSGAGTTSSLPHIEQIIAEKSIYNMLEVVPDGTSGSLGFYAAGSEPILGWTGELARISGTAARTSYVNTLFSNLAAAGISGDGTAYPISPAYYVSGSYYLEEKPWVLGSGTSGWSKLPLTNFETAQVTGTFTEVAAGNGDFKAEYAYTLSAGGGNVQNTEHMVYMSARPEPAVEDDYYYYAVPSAAWVDIPDIDDASEWTGQGAYKLTGGSYELAGIIGAFTPENGVSYSRIDLPAGDCWSRVEYLGSVGHLTGRGAYTVNADGVFVYQGLFGQIGLNTNYEYFYADPDVVGAPAEEWTGDRKYAVARTSQYFETAPGAGYFSRVATGYTYAETGGDALLESGTTEYTVRYREVYYKGGYTNNNLFLKEVFGLEDDEELRVRVTTVTVSNLTVGSMNTADLVFLSPGFDAGSAGTGYLPAQGYGAAAGDVTDAVGFEICRLAAENVPVIVDYRVANSGTDSNMRKAARFCAGDNPSLGTATNLGELTLDAWSSTAVYGDTDHTLVAENVYCFNPATMNAGVTVKNIATYWFASAFSTSTGENGGFGAVLDEIRTENFYREVAGLDEEDMLAEKVSVSTAVRYVINYAGQRNIEQPTAVRVLELQPANVSSALSPGTVYSSWLGSPPGFTQSAVTVKTYATGQFVGMIENINESYDLIYIGGNTSRLNTSSGTTVYNDTSMNGLIYSNVGDIYTANIQMAGLLDRDYMTAADGTYGLDGTSDTPATTFRFSGNDITEAKVADLEAFAEAGYPIVIDNALISSGAINPARVDASSYLYEALTTILPMPNVMSASEAVASASSGVVMRYLEVSKPEIELTGQPTVYSDTSASSSLTIGGDGYYYLRYEFMIKNATEPTPRTTTYNVKLYIDLNADGRYDEAEQLNDIEVSDEYGTAVIPVERYEDETLIQTYSLLGDRTYRIVRQMPTAYVGIIPWKLEVVKNGAPHIHASEANYARIAALSSQKQVVKVLQISDSDAGTSLINLEDQMRTGSGSVTYYDKGVRKTSSSKGVYGALLAGLDDFTVRVVTVEADALENMTGLSYYGDAGTKLPYAQPGTVTSDTIYEYLNNFDMLMIGFADMYGEIGDRTAPAVIDFIESKRSVLFTHDTTSLSNTSYADYPLIESDTASSTLISYSGSPSWTKGSGSLLTIGSSTAYSPSVTFNGAASGSISTTTANLTSNRTYQVSITISNFNETTDPTSVTICRNDDSNSTTLPINGNGTLSTASVTTGSSNGNRKIEIRFSGAAVAMRAVITISTGGSPYTPSSTLTWSTSGTASTSSISNRGLTLSMTLGQVPVQTDNYITLRPGNDLAVGTYRLTGTVTSSSNPTDIRVGVRERSSGAQIAGDTQSVAITGNGTYTVPFTVTSHGTVEFFISGTSGSVTFSTNTNSRLRLYKDSVDVSALSSVGSISYWGYNFNNKIRDYLGLDRYGVTNPDLKDFVAAGGSLTASQISDVREAQRGVAYRPSKTAAGAKSGTVPEVQGYTNYALIRFGNDTYEYTNIDYSGRETSYVQQINRGQITTYPYNINTEAFGGSDTTLYSGTNTPYMTVGNTHEQYYQVNMNTDDVVVWYCLSGAGSTSSYYYDVPGDAANAYYIYSKGNVMYSGVGHTAEQSHYTGTVEDKYVNEAKLFVNTMIASFQSSMQRPTVGFKDSPSGLVDLAVKYFTVEHSGSEDTLVGTQFTTENDKYESRALYFKITDPNLSSSEKTITAGFYYADPDGSTVPGIPEEVSAFSVTGVPSSPRSGVVYRAILPESGGPLGKLKDRNTTSVKIYLKVTTSIGSQSLYGADAVELRKIGLFNLS